MCKITHPTNIDNFPYIFTIYKTNCSKFLTNGPFLWIISSPDSEQGLYLPQVR